MRNLIGKIAAGSAATALALLLAGCGSDSAANNSAVNNLGATELNVGDPAAVETLGNEAGNLGGDSGTLPAATSNSAGTPPADVPADSTDVGGDTGGNAGAAINGM